jgi:citrate/tricarballylate utilization protein
LADSGAKLIEEGQRILTLCNACRYCEGYCAVFPAMERRTAFSEDDLNYLANLCHNCGECYYACPYSPPHEYALNVPQTLARIRLQSYERFTRPAVLGHLHRRRGGALVLAAATAVLGFLAAPGGSTFYEVVPHPLMAGLFGAAALWAAIALRLGMASLAPKRASFAGFRAAARDALAQTNMHRGPRRLFHHLTFYGFALCFASTTVAAFYHFALDRVAPYPILSLPVMLGLIGGLALLAGTGGQFWTRLRLDPALDDPAQRGEDQHFILLLWLTAATGLALLAWRDTAAMRPLLLIHLAVVFAFFLTMPYGKFVHGFFRFAALLCNACEARKRPGAPPAL